MEFASPRNPLIGLRYCSLVWPKSLLTKTSFVPLGRDQSSFRLPARIMSNFHCMEKEAATFFYQWFSSNITLARLIIFGFSKIFWKNCKKRKNSASAWYLTHLFCIYTRHTEYFIKKRYLLCKGIVRKLFFYFCGNENYSRTIFASKHKKTIHLL